MDVFHLTQILAQTNERYGDNFLPRPYGTGIQVWKFKLARPENEIKEIIIGCFNAGCLISLVINSDNWIHNILGIKEKPDSSLHVILIHGLYQPYDNRNNIYLYVSDPYCMKTLFLCWNDITSLIKKCPDVLLEVFTSSELPEYLKKYLYKESISKSKAKKIKKRLPNPRFLLK